MQAAVAGKRGVLVSLRPRGPCCESRCEPESLRTGSTVSEGGGRLSVPAQAESKFTLPHGGVRAVSVGSRVRPLPQLRHTPRGRTVSCTSGLSVLLLR